MDLPPIRVPKDRIGAVIGPNGQTKQDIEERSGVQLEIDSESGEVFLDASEAFEPALVLTVQDVVKAIARGFSPERSLRLFQIDSYLEVHEIEGLTGRKENSLDRVRARLIGTRGRTRQTIEEMTGVNLSIYGKTVSIIGEPDELNLAREAVEMICRGAPQTSVYKYLQRKRRELRLKEVGLA